MKKPERMMYRFRLKQRFMGVLLLIICGVILYMSFTGKTPEERDATAIVLLAPLALYMLFTKKIIIY